MNELILIVFYIACTFPFLTVSKITPHLALSHERSYSHAHLPTFSDFNSFTRNVVDICCDDVRSATFISGERCLRDQVCEHIEQQDTSSWIWKFHQKVKLNYTISIVFLRGRINDFDWQWHTIKYFEVINFLHGELEAGDELRRRVMVTASATGVNW
jgi:hypothetical protein